MISDFAMLLCSYQPHGRGWNAFNSYMDSREQLYFLDVFCVTTVCVALHCSVPATILHTGNWLQKILSDMMGKSTGNESFTDIKVFLYSAVS